MATLNETPTANRLHIAFFGRTNSGKSTLINTLTGQNISLVSPISGTTTDPVSKAMELLPIGPVVLIDTAGLDDTSELGPMRIQKSMEVIGKTDLAVLVIPSTQKELALEQKLIVRFRETKTPVIAVCNLINNEPPQWQPEVLGIPFLTLDARQSDQIAALKGLIIEHADFDFESPSLCGDLVKAGDTVVLVMPQDIQAPKGRLILPQVQVTRDLLDLKCRVVSVLTNDLAPMLKLLTTPPALVITDSQVFSIVNKVVPPEIPLTSFSILMAKFKGDIHEMVRGARAIASLHSGDKVLIMEACTHHALKGDIAREKLPSWLNNYAGGGLQIDAFSGTGFPENIGDYKLVIHCGGCMLNRKGMLTKIGMAERAGVPMTNFGTAIAFMNGILDRVVY
ncbi:MAG: [FeFe] hydrogenase H-cluster maturation GTPase HydF [Oscillospiraceae bacterium]|jgi:[FeFe] hydrogenase H-cluster maturation GTPase HydF